MMKAVKFESRKLSFIEMQIPEPGCSDVLIKVMFAGVCGTDLHITEGSFPSKESVILGHEFSGVAHKVGRDVKHIKVGDRVVVDPNSGCFTCQFCTVGKYHLCETGGLESTIGIWRNGGWAQFCVAPSNQVHLVPKNISLEQAALTEPVSCISHGYDRIAPLPVGSRILIQGAGIIGNLWACLLHLQGHRNVIVSEPQEQRRILVSRLETGFECISPSELISKSKEAGFGFDVIIDCSGNSKAMETSFNWIFPGGKLCVFGVAPPEAKMSISPFTIFKKEISIIGVVVNQFSFPRSLALIEAMGSRYIDYERLGIQMFRLSEYEKAMEQLHKGNISKALFKIEST